MRAAAGPTSPKCACFSLFLVFIVCDVVLRSLLKSIAQELALLGKHDVQMIGAGYPISRRPYTYKHIAAIDRRRFERWPKIPFLRTPFAYEDFSFAIGLLPALLNDRSDVTVTCNFPYTHWALRGGSVKRPRPVHIFVTQNGDWPAFHRNAEYRFFDCDGLVCTNPILLGTEPRALVLWPNSEWD